MGGDDDRDDLFLSEDPPPRRARPRWVDGAGLAAVVLGILAIGILGDRGDRGAPRPPTTTTPTTTASAFRRGRPPDPTTTTASTVPEPTTTTTIRLTPPLPFRSRTVLLVGTGGSVPTLVDVDGGTARRVELDGPHQGFGGIATDVGFLLPGPFGIGVIPNREGPPTSLTIDAGGAPSGRSLVASGFRTFWSTVGDAADGRIHGVEWHLDGTPTGRRADLPPGVYVAGWVEGGLVVAGHGSIALLDPGSGRVRSLGTGEVVTSGAHWVVRFTCHLLQCGIELLDVRTGRARSLPDVPLVTGYVDSGAVSADGRWIALSLFHSEGEGVLAVTDTRTGRGWSTSEVAPNAPVAFSPDGRLVFSWRAGRLCAYTVEDGTPYCFTGLDVSNAQLFLAAPAP